MADLMKQKQDIDLLAIEELWNDIRSYSFNIWQVLVAGLIGAVTGDRLEYEGIRAEKEEERNKRKREY